MLYSYTTWTSKDLLSLIPVRRKYIRNLLRPKHPDIHRLEAEQAELREIKQILDQRGVRYAKSKYD